MDQAVMRYFYVTDEKFDQRVLELIKQRHEIAHKWAGFARSYGALTAHTWQHSGEFAGFKFSNDSVPDPLTFKRVGDLWVPMKTKPKGKSVWKLAKLLPKPVSPNETLSDYDINWQIPTGDLWACVVGFVDQPGWFVKVPSRHFSAAMLEEFRLAGTTSEGRTTSPFWQPPAAWIELTEWAFLDKFHAQSQL